ncbi:hypothetical protein ZIOFF_010146 [Zingiber officinale]|uniref:Uncharacterized protein n=1 Tax=Zingiber officinale TaxID=94328 RepID=A0A8J5HGL6_ZINOF|nr:hypothetical protein ZIOFF_010146 [Zingiber officinale]
MAKVHPNIKEYCIATGVEVTNDGKDKNWVLTVRRKPLLFNYSDFMVFDEEGNLLFRVDNYSSGRAGRFDRSQKQSLGDNWTVCDGEDAADRVYFVKK